MLSSVRSTCAQLGNESKAYKQLCGVDFFCSFLSMTSLYFLVPWDPSILSSSQRAGILVTLLFSVLLKCAHILSQTIEGQATKNNGQVPPSWNYNSSAEGKRRFLCSELWLMWTPLCHRITWNCTMRGQKKEGQLQHRIFTFSLNSMSSLFCSFSQF